ncbi:DUF4302 domain-containing protein [Pinibacter aurantiacus]|uniref:DUF4302 domain-containing protein n=1 Tax=Pinibacter aurantiacus TaxID=2851599 RepID=A0A9E2S609_9BACT|nr:DUF4302 domain-containing protein [Pinibacter aurantiacus]MBV4356676.1 DUF4302 domain-containing protein [Pinibacter aurantiacus]
MKRFFLYLFVAMAALSSCQKEEKSVFDQTPDERINAALAKYQADVLSSPNGWKALYRTGTGQAFNFYFTFNNQNRVVMYSDFDTATTHPRESSYRIKALQQPCLIFDTYSYLHMLADPNPYVNGGDAGAGLVADFEFAIDTVKGDTIKLKGRQNGTELDLVKATQHEADLWTKGDWTRALGLQHITDFLTYFKRTTIGGVDVDVEFYHYSRQIVFFTYNSSGIRTPVTASFVYRPENPNGAVFTNPVKIGTATISSLTDMTWANGKVNTKVNGTTNIAIGEAIAPVVVNKNGATSWWLYKIQQGYWVNLGFHQNGVDDAFGVQSIPGFYYMAYLPAYDTATKTTYWDWMAYAAVKDNILTIPNSSSFVPTFITDGRAIFNTYKPDSANAPLYVTLTTAAFTDPQGYYFLQVGPTTIDMVGVRDAKTWLRWYWVE